MKASHKESLPSMAGAHKAAGIGAVFQGGLNFGVYVFQKHKEGKELWQFDTEDWQDGGLTFSKGAVKGGITGYGIYALTNVCHLGAPSAGAILSGTFGLINASVQYRSGVIDADGLIELATLNAIDATGAAVGAAIGQAIIPIPVVGAVIGSIISSTILSLGKDFLNKKELELISQYQAKNDNYIEKLAKEYLTKYKELMAKYQLLGELQHYSFDFALNLNLQLAPSIELAKQVGVSEGNILHNLTEIDAYFLI